MTSLAGVTEDTLRSARRVLRWGGRRSLVDGIKSTVHREHSKYDKNGEKTGRENMFLLRSERVFEIRVWTDA